MWALYKKWHHQHLCLGSGLLEKCKWQLGLLVMRDDRNASQGKTSLIRAKEINHQLQNKGGHRDECQAGVDRLVAGKFIRHLFTGDPVKYQVNSGTWWAWEGCSSAELVKDHWWEVDTMVWEDRVTSGALAHRERKVSSNQEEANSRVERWISIRTATDVSIGSCGYFGQELLQWLSCEQVSQWRELENWIQHEQLLSPILHDPNLGIYNSKLSNLLGQKRWHVLSSLTLSH